MSSHNWRSKFIELSESLFRELGFSPPPMLHEESLPLAMELEFEGARFELLHSSSDLPERILLICKLGTMPDENEITGIQGLMRENLIRLRAYEGWYGVSTQDHEIQMMCHKDLESLSAADIFQQMKKMISDSNGWHSHFSESVRLNNAPTFGLSNSILA